MKNYAIGNDGEVDFPLDPNGSGGSSVYSAEGKKTMNVKSKSIHTILNEFNLNEPYLLDLDIKGKEFETINDASISKFKMVRIEYEPRMGEQYLGTREELLRKLSEYDFKKIRIFKHNGGLYDLIDHGTIEAKK